MFIITVNVHAFFKFLGSEAEPRHPTMVGSCFWARKWQASTLHDCADIDDAASILRGIGLEALAKTVQIAATRDTKLTSAAICSLLNNVSVEWFTSNLNLQLQDVSDDGSKPASAMLPSLFIQPRGENENESKHASASAAKSVEPAASSEPDPALDSLRMQSPRKFEPQCSLAHAMNAAPYPKTTGSDDASCERMDLQDMSASANSTNVSQQRTPGMSLGAERERTSPSAAFTSLSDLTASVLHECETPL